MRGVDEVVGRMPRKARRAQSGMREDHRRIGWLIALTLAVAIGIVAYGVVTGRL